MMINVRRQLRWAFASALWNVAKASGALHMQMRHAQQVNQCDGHPPGVQEMVQV